MPSFGIQFGRLVKERRGVERLTLDDLAAKSELTKAQISNIERGKVPNPHTKTVDALCVALDIKRDERAACYDVTPSGLPPRLLENLALRFGYESPDAREDELVSFLIEKAQEFRRLQERLAKLAEVEEQISHLVTAAVAAIGEGEFQKADKFLQDAEYTHLRSTTIPALEKQAKLRIERGNAALMGGDVAAAYNHFEQAATYFSGIDNIIEASTRHEYSLLLRAYGYRYMSHKALYAAKRALHRNIQIWNKDDHIEKWCKTKVDLGAVSWRLSHFDNPDKSLAHLDEAKRHYEDVLNLCSEDVLPLCFAAAASYLANIYTERVLATSDTEYESNIVRSQGLRASALRFITRSNDPIAWGIQQHNLGLSYILLSTLRRTDVESVADLENAISHVEQSFEVRDPENDLQHWVASCRTLGEALLNLSQYSIVSKPHRYVRRASKVLGEAAARISPSEHPTQWRDLQKQLERCSD